MTDSNATPTDDAEAYLDQFKLPDSFSLIAETKQPTDVDITRPGKTSWVMVHPSLAMRAVIVQVTEERGNGIYVVRSDMLKHIKQEDCQLVDLHLAVARNGAVFLWPRRIGAADSWSKSMDQIIELARGTWVRVISERGDGKTGGRYVARTPEGSLPPPVWPAESFAEIVKRATKSRMIDSADHPIVRELAGHSASRF
jgi:hypothetical protein